MTEWNIYTVGSIDFIHHVFNAVAMLSNAGTFSSMFRIAALLGIIGIVIASAMSAGKTLGFQNMAVCVVMYMLFFQVHARVNIEDVTSGAYKAVDNVPVGLAASASIISTVGHLLSENMEQAFSTPAMTEYGAIDPLFAMATLYDSLKDPMRWATTQSASQGNADLQRSVQSYVTNCVSNDILRGATSYAKLIRSSKGIFDVDSPDQAQRVFIYDGLGTGWSNGSPSAANESLYVCQEALNKIRAQVSATSSNLTNSFNRMYTAAGRLCGGSECTGTTKTTEVMDFYNLSGTDIRDFQLSVVMESYLRALPITGPTNSYQGYAAVTRAQTQTQQAFQWASGGSSFLNWMTSFMPIFQGVIYSLAPFMAFLLGLGIMGVRLLMKYLLVVVWTQTWLPLAAVINMYVLSKTQSEISGIMAAVPAGFMPFSALYDILISTQRNIGLAGNLFSLIPALGGFIVWGSSIAFNSLANSAAAPAAADTKTMAPDLSNAPAINSRTSETSYSPTTGTNMTGASNIVGGISMGDMAQSMMSSAKSELSSASVQEQAARTSAINALSANATSGTHSQAQNKAVGEALSKSLGSSYDAVKDVAHKNGWDETQTLAHLNTLSNKISGNASASGSVGPETAAGQGKLAAALGIEMSGANQTSDMHSKQGTSSDSSGSGSSSRLSDASATNLSKSIQSTVNDVMSQSSSFGLSSSEGSSYSSAYQNMQTASKQYTEAETFSQSSALSQTIGFDALGQTVNQSPGLQQKMDQIGAGIPGFAERRDMVAAQMENNGMSGVNAHAAASVVAMKDAGQLHQVAGNLGFINGGSSPEINPMAASEHRGVSGGASGAGAEISNIQNSTAAGISSSTASAHAGVNATGAESSPSKVQGEIVDRFRTHTAGDGAVQRHNSAGDTNVKSQQSRNAYENIQAFEPNNPARAAMGTANSLTSRLNFDNPTIEHEVASVSNQLNHSLGGGEATKPLADFYAAGKAGMGGEGLDAFRERAMASVQLETGGHKDINGTVTGGNVEYAARAVSAIESTFERQGFSEPAVVESAVNGIAAARDYSMPSNTNQPDPYGSLMGARSNGSYTGVESEQKNNIGPLGSSSQNSGGGTDEPIRIVITKGVDSDPLKD